MITSIKTNLKSLDGAHREFKLHQRTLIVGASASGKSAVTQAVELACESRMSDFTGRQDSSLRTVQRSLSVGDLCFATEGEAGPLTYREVLESIQSSPLEAHVKLLGARLSSEARDLYAQLKTAERQKRELAATAAKAKAAQEYCAEFPELVERTARDLALAEVGSKDLDSRLDGLRAAVRLAVQAAWTADLLADVGRYIPKSLGKLVISAEGGFGLGLQRKGEPARLALSGSEMNIALTALAVRDGALVIPADRAIDTVLLREWLQALSNAPCQILLTTTLHPGTLPKGWHILKVGNK